VFSTDGKGRLRPVRIAADGILGENILPKGRLTRESVGLIAGRLVSIAGEMEVEWGSDPASAESREAFRLLREYQDRQKKYRKGSV
jgi:hypothetical protein